MSALINVDSVEVGHRHRRDLGDIGALAKSIADVGLLHPIVITPERRLIAGARRLEAARVLGWSDIPATVVDLAEIVKGEFAENYQRKDFTPTEMVAIGEALERQIATPVGRPKNAGKLPGLEYGDTRDKVAAFVGVSGRTYEKAKAVVDVARAAPDRFGQYVAEMDRTGKVDGAYRKMKRAAREERREAPPDDLPARTERYDVRVADVTAAAFLEESSVDCIITDPPYPAEHLETYSALSRASAAVLKPGGSCVVMIGQSYLPEIIARMSEHLTYQWCLAYLTPGGQSAQLWQRKVNTFWKPLLWFVKGAYEGDWIGDVTRSDPNDNDKRFHHWGQSESGFADIVRRFTRAGDVIFDPFCGGGTTGVVALDLNRRFIGADISPESVRTTLQRLNEAGGATGTA